MANRIQKLEQSIEKKNMNAKNLILKQKVNVFLSGNMNTLFPMGLNNFQQIMKKYWNSEKKIELIQFFDKMQHELWIAIKYIQTVVIFKGFSLWINWALTRTIKIVFPPLKTIAKSRFVYYNVFVSFWILAIFPLKFKRIRNIQYETQEQIIMKKLCSKNQTTPISMLLRLISKLQLCTG